MVAITSIEDYDTDSFAIRQYDAVQFDQPDGSSPNQDAIYQYRNHLQTVAGKTESTCHYIPTTGSRIKVSPRLIPAHYCTEVECQISQMLAKEIIECRSSPWMTPMLFVLKKSDELCL